MADIPQVTVASYQHKGHLQVIGNTAAKGQTMTRRNQVSLYNEGPARAGLDTAFLHRFVNAAFMQRGLVGDFGLHTAFLVLWSVSELGRRNTITGAA